MKYRLTALGLTLALLSQLVWPQSTWAAASLFFSGNDSVTVGQSWSVNVLVNTTQPVNAAETIVSFPANLLEVTSVGNGGSVFASDGPGSPSIDNSAGKVHIIRYSLSSYNGSSGQVATINFKTKAVGSGTLTFGVSKVIAHDGNGTNVYSGGSSKSFTVNGQPAATPQPNTPAPPSNNSSSQPSRPSQPTVAAPAITSTTHPDPNAWYQQKQVEAAWSDPSAKASGYAVEVNQNPHSQLSEKISQTATTFSHQIAGDGAWYLHVRSQTSSGWSSTAHYPLQVDTTAPGAPTITIDPASPMQVRPSITFSATDNAAGIANYKIKFNQSDWQEAASPYKPETITSGQHTILVQATDKAGNTSQAEATFTVSALEVPVVHQPVEGYLRPGEFFKVSGKTIPGVTVEIYINGQLDEQVTADDQGNFTGQSDHFLLGSYTVAVRAINSSGIASPLSPEIAVRIGGLYILGIAIPDWLTYVGLAAIMLALLAVIGYLIYRLRQRKGLVDDQQFKQQLDQLEKDLEQTIDQTLAADQPSAQQLKQQLEAKLDTLEQTVESSNDSQPTSTQPHPLTRAKAIPVAIVATGTTILSSIKARLKKSPKVEAETNGQEVVDTPEPAIGNQPSAIGNQQPAPIQSGSTSTSQQPIPSTPLPPPAAPPPAPIPTTTVRPTPEPSPAPPAPVATPMPAPTVAPPPTTTPNLTSATSSINSPTPTPISSIQPTTSPVTTPTPPAPSPSTAAEAPTPSIPTPQPVDQPPPTDALAAVTEAEKDT